MTSPTNPEPPVSTSIMRNRNPILSVLRELLAPDARVLEVASGSGAHAIHFASHLPEMIWQPTEVDIAAVDAMSANFAEVGLPNLRNRLQLDVAAPHWPNSKPDVIVAINLIHISPWASTKGLMAGAGRVLNAGGLLLLYGPFKEDGVQTAGSNLDFDQSLKLRNSRWGLRNLSEVAHLARDAGLELESRIEMPSNNLCVAFRRI